jgi:hypothetical protein
MTAKLKATYAFIDITRGQFALQRRLRKGEEVHLDLRVRIDADERGWSIDAESTEFTAIVESAREVC